MRTIKVKYMQLQDRGHRFRRQLLNGEILTETAPLSDRRYCPIPYIVSNTQN